MAPITNDPEDDWVSPIIENLASIQGDAEDYMEERGPKSEDTFVPDEKLKEFRIKRTLLDLDAVKTPFVKPIPVKQLRKWGEERDAWEHVDRDGYTRQPHRDQWWNAFRLNNSTRGFLGKEDEKSGLPCIESLTTWNDFGYKMVICEMDWPQIDFLIIERKSGLGFMPHKHCRLYMEARFPDNEALSSIEITLLAVLARRGLLEAEEAGEKPPVIPITVLSMACSKARVIHGAFNSDGSAGTFAVSKVLDFTKAGSCKTDDFLYLISWLFAEPLPI